MNYNEIITVKQKFDHLSSQLLNSTERTFKINLLAFKNFCDSSKVIIQILEPIKDSKFNGFEYFSFLASIGSRFDDNKPMDPETQIDHLKVSYDSLWSPEINSTILWNYAINSLYTNSKNIDELLKVGNKDISGRLISYINSELDIISVTYQKEVAQTQLNFNIGNVNNSILGSQANATINNSCNLENVKELVEQNVQDSKSKEELNELISLLKIITENNMPVSKGALAKFSEAIEKHSWITGALAQTLIGWLISK